MPMRGEPARGRRHAGSDQGDHDCRRADATRVVEERHDAPEDRDPGEVAGDGLGRPPLGGGELVGLGAHADSLVRERATAAVCGRRAGEPCGPWRGLRPDSGRRHHEEPESGAPEPVSPSPVAPSSPGWGGSLTAHHTM